MKTKISNRCRTIFITFLSCFMFTVSFAQPGINDMGNTGDAHYLVEKYKSKNADSAFIDIEVLEAHPNKHSKPHPDFRTTDVWLNDCRYSCDSSGHVKLAVKPGKIDITARSLCLKSISNTVEVNKGEKIVIKYYLGYGRHDKPYGTAALQR